MEKEYCFIKEIREQPDRIKETLLQTDAQVKELAHKYCGKVDRIILTGCGDPYMLGIGAAYAFEEWAKIPADSIEAAELSMYRGNIINEKTLVILISSTGKTIKVIDSAKLAIEKKAPHFGLVNLAPSSLTEISKDFIQTKAGWSDSFPTKQTTAALAVLLSMALYWAEFACTLSKEKIAELRNELYEKVPQMISDCLKLEKEMKSLAEKYAAAPFFGFLGSGPNLCTAVLAAAKMKETSQSRSWAVNFEECAHLFQLQVKPGDPIFMFHHPGPSGKISAGLSNQILTYGANPIIIGSESEKGLFDTAKCEFFAVPDHDERFATLIEWIPAQLFAYYVSLAKGLNPDKPVENSDIEKKYNIYTSPLEGWEKR